MKLYLSLARYPLEIVLSRMSYPIWISKSLSHQDFQKQMKVELVQIFSQSDISLRLE